MKYIDLSRGEKLDILSYVSGETGMSQAVIEKDWWVTTVLRSLFNLPYSEYLSFKGGTSLSKCWGLISRMSEDIDIGLSREYLGFSGELSKTQISDKLRRASCRFVRETMQHDLRQQLNAYGLRNDTFMLNVNITPVSTTDPEIIEVQYDSVLTDTGYIHSKVIIEVSGRSMSGPVKKNEVQSFIDDYLPNSQIFEGRFSINAVLPQRTFLEKVFLLHEEFSKPLSEIRIDRMSRHMYDIYKITENPIAKEALSNNNLYESIVNHRKKFIGLKGFDYSTLCPQFLNIIPPESIIDAWRNDYEQMRRSMIYGSSPSFEDIIKQMKKLNEFINDIPYSITLN